MFHILAKNDKEDITEEEKRCSEALPIILRGVHSMGTLFKALKVGFEEAIAHDQGKLDLRSEFIEVSKPPARYRAEEIKKVREKKTLRRKTSI